MSPPTKTPGWRFPPEAGARAGPKRQPETEVRYPVMPAAALNEMALPLARHRLFRTDDPAEARHRVARSFCAHDLRLTGKATEFDAIQNRVCGHGLSLSYLRYGAGVAVRPGRLAGFHLVQIPISGGAEVRAGRRRIALDANRGAVLNPEFEGDLNWHAGCGMLILRIDGGMLADVAAALIGREPARPVAFDAAIDRQHPALARWFHLLSAWVAEADSEAALPCGGTHRQRAIEEQLVARFLLCQPSAISHYLTATERSTPVSGQLRRARSYIHEGLAEPLTLARIARAAGCGVRSLQTGFRDAFGCSPMQYLHRERLKLAHHLLQTAPEGETVLQIADAAGFAHPGRFAIAYRQTFGHSPGATLKASRRR